MLFQKSRLLLFLLGLLCLPVISAYSQAFTFKTTEASKIKSGGQIITHGFPDTITVRQADWFTVTSGTGWGSNLKFKSIQGFIKFKVDHAFPKKIATNYVYKMAYVARGYANPADTNSFTSYSDTLLISYNPDSLSAYQNMASRKYPKFHKLVFIITGIYDATNPEVPPALVTDKLNFQVEGSILTQKYNKNSYGPTAALTAANYPASIGKNYLDVRWNLSGYSPSGPVVLTPASYELEWAYIDDYKLDPATGTETVVPTSALKYDFRYNSTRVWTDTNAYRIPLIYPKGYVVYRVRLVRPDSVLYQYPVYGAWTLPDTGFISSTTSNDYFQIVQSHEGDKLNYQYTVSFAEQGKYKHVLSYFDGLLKNRQTITRFNSTPDRLLVTENVYDFEGRPAIKTLPAPVYDTAFHYLHNVSLNAVTDQPYKAGDFDIKSADICPDEPMPAPLDSTALASIYYSSLNPNQSGYQKFVPDAQGYPFVTTIYSAAFNDRVERQGGAGPYLQPGTPHDQSNEYVGADQPDLNRLFGTDIGYANYYRKTVSRDPNGQLSTAMADHNGRQVATAMIGAPANGALVLLDSLPDVQYFEDNLISGTASDQQIIGNVKKLETTKYMDVAGIDSVEYIYTFEPYDLNCGKYLSVQAAYNYSITDKCGNLLRADAGVLGITGVVTDPAPISSPSGKDTFTVYFPGAISLKKELTIRPEDVAAAVDSFITDPGNCMLTEPYFIKQSVLEESFPCPYADDPCAAAELAMMQELYPGAIYGTHSKITGHIDGVNSIFTVTGYLYNSYIYYRYQDSCLVELPDSIYVGGNLYTNLATLPADTFLYVYENADLTQKNLIAHALLPLHPEYCRLLACFPDTFREKLLSIPNAAVAESLNLLYLPDIVDQDPLTGMLETGGYVNPEDSLSTLYHGNFGLDTLSTLMAYCNCADTVMFRTCLQEVFGHETSNLLLSNGLVKEKFFSTLLPLYITNRDKHKAVVTGSTDDCGPCAEMRMELAPPPHIPIFPASPYASDGSMSTGPGSFLSLLSDSTADLVTGMMDAMASTDDGTLDAYLDSATLVVTSGSALLCTGQVDTIIARLANCNNHDVVALAHVRDSLLALCASGQVQYGEFSPAQIRYALVSNGINLDDLCNPWLVNYEPWPIPSGAANMQCLDDNFYTGVRQFLNRPEALFALLNATTGSTQTLTLSTGNSFEQQLNSQVNPAAGTVKLHASYQSSSNLYTIFLYDAAATYADPGDTAKIYLHGSLTASGPCLGIFTGASAADTITITAVQCFRNTGVVLPNSGYINNFAFGLTVRRATVAGVNVCNMTGWTDSVLANTETESKIVDCVPCSQMRTLYNDFADTLMAYGIKGTDHPYYPTMLRTFMTYKLRKNFTTGKYIDFIESCALADSMTIGNYVAYSTFIFNSEPAVEAFLSQLNAVSPDVIFPNPYRESTGSQIKVLVNLNAVPVKQLYLFKQFLSGYTAPGLVTKIVNQPLSTLQSANTVGFLFAPTGSFSINLSSIFPGTPPFTLSSPSIVNIKMGSSYQPHSYYTVTAIAGTTPAQLSEGIGRILQYCWDSAVFLPNFLATVNDDYFLEEKKAYLRRAYSFPTLPVSRVLDSLQADALMAQVPAYSGRTVMYGLPLNPGLITNLYIADPSGANSRFDTLNRMLGTVADNLPGHSIFPLFAGDTRTWDVPGYGSDDFKVYLSSDGSYWYRYFGHNDTLYNFYVRMPLYIPRSEHPLYKLISLSPAPGDSTTRSVDLVLEKAGDTPIHITGQADFVIGRNLALENVLLGNEVTASIPAPDTIKNCERSLLTSAIQAGIVEYHNYVDSMRYALNAAFNDYVMHHLGEKLTLGYQDRKFLFTLYYYDRAGNLTATVPPDGVHRLDNGLLDGVDGARNDNATDPGLLPGHKKISTYKYNSLNKLLYQKTPDGGEVHYFLDGVGRTVFSQNDKQKPLGDYTYTLYDKQGRITETGEATLGCPWFPEYTVWMFYENKCQYVYPLSDSFFLLSPHQPFIRFSETRPLDSFISYVHAVPRRDVVLTTYDTATIDLDTINGMSAQQNLRKRVAALRYYEHLPAGDTSYHLYTYASYYSYDIAGNVKTLTHDFPALKEVDHRFKRIDYDYDLISGKVNMLSYNRSFPDQYYQRYHYDDDNRITAVESSPDGYLWQRDASYAYYEHGPLARTSLGDLRVQGLDYAYTLQGWLKAINGEVNDTTLDMGRDGTVASVHSRDAYGATLSYFTGDYRPIGGTPFSTGADIPSTASLFNGNIPRQHTALLPLQAQSANYSYDQLNRINGAGYQNYDSKLDSFIATTNYASRYRYDQDGNLRYLMRQGVGGLMDSLMYRYAATQTDNRLLNVAEYAPDPADFNNDIRNFTDINANRYAYDLTGNLIKDLVSGQDSIHWNLYGKMTGTKNSAAGKNLSFTYDGAGNRVAKYYTKYDGRGDRMENEYYVRDAQGNTLAVYGEAYKYSPIDFVASISEDIIGSVGPGPFIGDFVGHVYAIDGDFAGSVLGTAGSDPLFAAAMVHGQPPSYYCDLDPGAYEGMLYTGVNYMQPLRAYQATAGDTLLGKALAKAYSGKEGTSNDITDAMFGQGVSTTMKGYVLGLSCAAGDSLIRRLASLNRINLPAAGSCQAKADTLARHLPDLGTLKKQLNGLYGYSPTSTAVWLNQIAIDSTVWAYPLYTGSGQGQGGFLYALRDVLTDYGDRPSVYAFWDSWAPAFDLLEQAKTPAQLLSLRYGADPVFFLDTLSSAKGMDSTVYKALSVIPGLTAESYLSSAISSLPAYAPTPVILKQNLDEHRFWLAEHHLYGSSRLGIRSYWRSELYSLWSYDESGAVTVDSSRFALRRPWYSLEYQDGIKSSQTTQPYGAADSTEALSFQQQTGKKGYELTNHLGNVMAVVSDKRTNLDDNGDTLIDRYSPSLAAVYDYYPFGMLMPGRFKQDSASHCMVSTQTMLVPVTIKVAGPVSGPLVPVLGGTGTVITGGVLVSSHSPGDGVSVSTPVTAGLTITLELEVSQLSGAPFAVLVKEPVGAQDLVLGGATLSASGMYKVTVTPGGSTLKLVYVGSGVGSVLAKPWTWTKSLLTPKNVPVLVCNETEDYRFGFNGQEKVNEIAGIGNHIDFGARGLDTRIGRWWSIDPLYQKFPSESPYNFGGNNPIYHIDKLGEEKTSFLIIHTDQGTTRIKTVTKGEFHTSNHTDGFSEYTRTNNFAVTTIVDLRKGTKPENRIWTSGPIVYGKDKNIFQRMGEKMSGVRNPLPQVMVFGSGRDYGDWLKNPRADPNKKTYTIDFKEFDDIMSLVLTAHMSSPEFNAPTGPESFETAVEKGVELLNDKINDKKKEQGEGSGYCIDCDRKFKDGKPDSTKGATKDTIRATQHK